MIKNLQPSLEKNTKLWGSYNTPLMLFLVIISIGVILRLRQYLANRSLWLDEALLALNIINKSFSELSQPLDYDQGAPLGFLWIEKSITVILDSSEYSLRLFPLIGSILSLFVFYFIVLRYLNNKRTIFFALLLYAISTPLIYYASESKQYTNDILMALLGINLLFPLIKEKTDLVPLALCTLGGAILIWMSHPVIFILVSVGLVATYSSLRQKNYYRTRLLIFVWAVWAVSFLSFYFLSLQDLTQNQYLLSYWDKSFVPWNNPLNSINWLINGFLKIFEYPVGLPLFGLAALMYFIGIISVFEKSKIFLFSLLLPLAFVFLAAFLHKYPFGDRHILFMVPLIIMLIAEGLDKTLSIFSSIRLHLVGLFLLGLFFYHPLIQAGSYLIAPQLREEIRPAIEYVLANQQEGDILYLYYASHKPFEYYLSAYNINLDNDIIIGVASRNDWSKYIMDLTKLREYKRVWLLFSHVHSSNGANEELLFLNYLNSIGGIQIDKYQTIGASVYLYEF